MQTTDDVMTAWRTHKRLGMVGRSADGGVSAQTLAGFVAGLYAGGATTTALAGFVDALDRNHRGRGIGSPVDVPQVRDYLVALKVVPSQAIPEVDLSFLGTEVEAPEQRKARSKRAVPDVGFDPTAEQLVALEKFRTGRHLVIEAGAGSGKTSTLRLLAEDAPGRKGLYFAYNKAIAAAAGRALPRQVDCRTLHSLAYRPMIRQWPWLQDRLQERPMRRQVAAQFGFTRIFEQWRPDPGAPYESVTISAYDVFVAAEKTVEKFCQSDSTAVGVEHLPASKYAGAPVDVVEKIVKRLLLAAQRVWDDLTSEDGVARLSHDHYLKAWALTNPDLGVDYLLLDEAQDSNDLTVGLARTQAENGTQIVTVGDAAQAIYEFRGSRNHMRAFDGERASLSTSFRFGQPIADEANKWLTYLGASMRLAGSPLKTTAAVGPIFDTPDAYLTRTNAHGVEALIRYQDEGIPTRIADGAKDVRDVAQAAADFANFKRVKHPALRQYSSWEAAVEDARDENGDMDGSLAAMVKVVAKFGHATVIRALDTQAPAGKERVTISTAHKAKGLEWDRVRVGDDFPNPYDGVSGVVLNPDTGKLEQPPIEHLPNDEAMLAYVAITRAKEHVDPGSLSWISRAVAEGATTTGEPLG